MGSGPPAEALRGAYEAFYEGDASALAPHVADDLVAVDRSGAPDAGAYRGRDEYLAWATAFLDLFLEVRLESLRLEPLPGGRLLVVMDLSGTTHGGSVPIALQIVHVLEFRDGLIARLDGFVDEQAAIEFACG